MGSIFDENSEFLEYLKKKNGLQPQEPSAKPEDVVELHITGHKDKDPYVLNLKHVELKDPPHEPPSKKQQTTKQDPNFKKLEKLAERPSFTSNLSGFLWDKIKFLLVSATIFLIGFVALNWSAYSQIAYNWYLNYSGKIENSPLKEYTKTVQAKDEDEIYQGVPVLNLEVTPPGIRIIIPRINQNVPVVGVADDRLLKKDWDGLEQDIQDALKGGVIHYPGTPWFDQSGNVVVTGHSSYYPWDPGRFKDVFALLHQLSVGDEIVVFYNQQKYKYTVTDMKVVLPSQVNVLGDTGDDRLTLITCTPVGTNLKRLIVTAKPSK